ncbi:uncharacterized protein SAPINGB_P003564 [Magnusiomyces paraingens]|uniref:Zn(2)-C6 fungal-type domain-containing protein n=1 Tax=Magnusiomyces paraingens TaxID=2606893 RepID=A0A5E8BSA0_9ASCO|nr:uncharacterized protein SAPINGB_P003564 [Saprochaete ingens]VVT53419.1 unnamed protein product [Saprochaete ingens]
MPDGALAWKMIKTPGSHTDRIAQACDRCRSKKIRCDGKRPHCSQCLSVGFECKTSDKLSRRAFPRGYTESLEDRVRQLESENTKLLNLLDIKDEQMEMLSKVEANAKQQSLQNQPSPQSNTLPQNSPLNSSRITNSAITTTTNSNSNSNSNSSSSSSSSNTPTTPAQSSTTPTSTSTTTTTTSTSTPTPTPTSTTTITTTSPPPPPQNFSNLINNLKSAQPQDSSDDEEAYVVHQINTLSPEETYRGSAAGGVFIDAFLEKLRSKNCNMIPQLKVLFGKLNTPYIYDPNQITINNNSYHSQQALSPLDMSMPITPASIASPISPASSSYLSHRPSSCAGSNNLSSSSSSTTTPFFTNLNIPSRLSADKLTATYFHEWNTMYAVLDQYAYLDQYQRVMNALSSAEQTNNYDHPDLRGNELFIIISLLVSSLGSLALKDKSSAAITESWRIEKEWKRLFTADLQTSPSLATVQALVLAELYSLHTGNQDDVWHFRMMAASMSQRLGLHRCHKSLKLYNGDRLPFYQQEMRRRIFWVAYTLDCFSAALLGSPRLLNDRDIECAPPSNIDDEMLRNHEETPPVTNGEKSTQMTCPLSVIHFAKIFGTILDTIYSSTKRSHPYKTVVMLEDMLEQWRRELPAELKFEFANGMPAATHVTLHQKSPLLLVMYHYARVLIHMPAISAPSLGTTAGARGSASCVAVMQSSKVVIQVMNYLKARCVVPTLCMNTPRFTVFFGAVVLYGAVDYSRGGALLLEIRKIMASAITHLYSDLQLHRPGSLIPESYQIFEEACDTLLNSSASRKNSDAAAVRKRRSTVSKRRDSKPTTSTAAATAAIAAIPTSITNTIQPHYAPPITAAPTPASIPSPKLSPPSGPVNIASQPSCMSSSSMHTPSPTDCGSNMPSSQMSLQNRSNPHPSSMVHIKQEDDDLEIDQLLSRIPSSKQLEKESINQKSLWNSSDTQLRDDAYSELMMLNAMAGGSRSRSVSSTNSTSSGGSTPGHVPSAAPLGSMMENVPLMTPIDLFFDSGMISTSFNSKQNNNNGVPAALAHSNSSSSSSLSKLTESLAAAGKAAAAAATTNATAMASTSTTNLLTGSSGAATPLFCTGPGAASILNPGAVGNANDLFDFFNTNWADTSLWAGGEDH